MVIKAKKNNLSQLSSSYRDPSGYLFFHEGTLYRRIDPSYKTHYDTLMRSGLYKELVSSSILIPHREIIDDGVFESLKAYKIIQPDFLPFISYPYEWSFSMLKDAALLTLTIQKKALSKGMILKDATPYNIQFYKGKPILIDTLSFEVYTTGRPWVAYRQFCEMFLAPLALCATVDEKLIDLLRIYIDGISLDLTSKLLPFKSKLSVNLLVHIFLHARSQTKITNVIPTNSPSSTSLSTKGLLDIIDNLESSVSGLSLPHKKTVWTDYYNETNYSETGMSSKKRLVEFFLKDIKPKTVWDMGANTGEFSLISSGIAQQTIAMDFDYIVIERLYMHIRAKNITNILPLRLDLSNPPPAIGWANQERLTLPQRGKCDVLMALALIHHIAIAKNVPFEMISSYFAKLTKYLIIEFVPKNDSQVQKLLASREDVFSFYTQEHFEKCFLQNFSIKKRVPIKDTKRTLYLMQSI